MPRPLAPLALTVLRMLHDGPMHPYEMQQRIRHHAYDRAVKVTHGALYHAVERLTAGGLIEPVETGREGRRPERTVYAITEAGRDTARMRMVELLAEPAEEFPLFGTALAFVNLLSEDEVARHLRRRQVTLEALLAGNRAVYDVLGERGLERFKLIDHELTLTRHRAELDLVRGLADDLEAGRLTWSDDRCDGTGKDGRPAENGKTDDENGDRS
ncbi:PadR family transcriptional regulator [Actinomadura rugatobispora]|uniref:PadR family transcriptional regulator n=1 Tax=Actinomadura rugatobispora TaxID=1994 RepID=A0ABW1A233_9ACTN|nr:PadR family transcriptional regulator [Actinomadura rugatobispora]